MTHYLARRNCKVLTHNLKIAERITIMGRQVEVIKGWLGQVNLRFGLPAAANVKTLFVNTGNTN